MTYQAMTWATTVRTGSPVLKSVLLMLANRADEYGYCFPSQAKLSWDTELSERAVRDALNRLEEMGIISRERRYGKDGYRTSDGIRLNRSYRNETPLGPKGLPAGDAGNEGETLPAGDAGKVLPAGDDDLTGTTGNSYRQDVPPNSQLTSKNNHTPISPDGDRAGETEYPVDFESLWVEVPKPSDDPLANPGSKAKAYAAWKKLSKAQKDACWLGWQAYLEVMQERRKKRPDYPIKQLVAWINGKEWETYGKDAA